MTQTTRNERERHGTVLIGVIGFPCGLSIVLTVLFATFLLYAETVAWRIVSALLFVTSSCWYVWFLRAKITVSGRAGMAPVSSFANRRHRRGMLFVPALAAVLCFGAFLKPEAIHYSALFGGGSPVVFDSRPRGATVRYAWILYAEGDPWLEDTSGDRDIFRIAKATRARVYLEPGLYWAVFELGNRRQHRKIVVEGPTEVTIQF